MVSSLIDPMTSWWRVDMVRATFLPFEADLILRIPLSHNLPEDKIIWIRNSRGDFTVKSAYHIAHNLSDSREKEECSNGDPCKLIWMKLWHLNLPTKMKFFSWRACVNGLPTMEAICCRGITQSRGCPVCSSEVESLDHALLHCAFSASVWCLWSDNPLRTHGINKSFLDSTIFILSPSYATLQDLELFFAIAWAIWFNRNKIVYKDSSLLPLQVWKMAKNVSEDFVSSATWDLGQPRTTPSSWVPPPSGFHKINVDGASSELDSFSSVGVVIRDCKGDVVAALCKPLQTRFFAKLTEVFSLEHGILLAQELHLAWVIVESNSLNAIQAINEGATGGSLGHILQGILQVSVSFESCLFKHINRSFNTPWKGVAPHYISSFLQSNLNVNDL